MPVSKIATPAWTAPGCAEDPGRILRRGKSSQTVLGILPKAGRPLPAKVIVRQCLAAKSVTLLRRHVFPGCAGSAGVGGAEAGGFIIAQGRQIADPRLGSS